MTPPPPAHRAAERQPHHRANIRQALRTARTNAFRNADVLDNISSPPPVEGAPQSPSPISKQLLHTIFDFLDPSTSCQSPSNNFIFIENHYENHFLYALVLPLIARLLAVSSPGLLCVVQLPRPHILPPWAASPSVEVHQSNISNISAQSKAPHQRTSSPNENTAEHSKADEAQPPDRKSDSPDGHPQTADLIRRANAVLADSETPRTTADTIDPQIQPHGDQSPPPDPLFHDHQALRLVCNGFEVLTGKMPPPKSQVGSFTLASVAWEKAAIISPQDPSKAVSMSFSNGMNTPTDGVVVTFSNGSMVMLTLLDPYTMLKSMTLSDATPVVVFSFAPAVGNVCMRQLLSIKSPVMSPDAGSVKELCQKPNVLVVEIGHSLTPNSSVTDGLTDNDQARRSDDDELEVNHVVGDAPSNVYNDGKQRGHHATQPPCQSCPPLLIEAVPRAVPLFVNTISQAFVDPTQHEHSNKIYDDEETVMDNPPMNGADGSYGARHQFYERETTTTHRPPNSMKDGKQACAKPQPPCSREQAAHHSSDGCAHSAPAPASNGVGQQVYPSYHYAHPHYSFNGNARYAHHVQDTRANMGVPTFRSNGEGHPHHINHHAHYMHGRPGTNFQGQYHPHHAMPVNPHMNHHAGYAPNPYYQGHPVVPQNGLTSPRANPAEWHRAAKPPQPSYAGPEHSASDARRDMPANFSSHSAIALRARRK